MGAKERHVYEHRSTLASFSRAAREAAGYVNAHPAETVDALATFTGVPAAAIARMTRASMATTLDPKLIQPVVDVCVRYKTILTAFDAATMIASGMG